MNEFVFIPVSTFFIPFLVWTLFCIFVGRAWARRIQRQKEEKIREQIKFAAAHVVGILGKNRELERTIPEIVKALPDIPPEDVPEGLFYLEGSGRAYSTWSAGPPY